MRLRTTVPQQALFLLNSPFVAEQARLAESRFGSRSQPSRSPSYIDVVFSRSPETRRNGCRACSFVAGAAAQPLCQPPEPVAVRNGEFRCRCRAVSTAFSTFTYFHPETAGKARRLARPATRQSSLTRDRRRARRAARSGRDPPVGQPGLGQVTSKGRSGMRSRPCPRRRSSRRASFAAAGRAGVMVCGRASAETKTDRDRGEKGDVIDFVVDARADPETMISPGLRSSKPVTKADLERHG